MKVKIFEFEGTTYNNSCDYNFQGEIMNDFMASVDVINVIQSNYMYFRTNHGGDCYTKIRYSIFYNDKK